MSLSSQRGENTGKRYCRNCKQETLPRNLCVCSGGGSGSPSSGEERKDEQAQMGGVASASAPVSAVSAESASKADNSTQPSAAKIENQFDTDVIAELIANKVLSIDNNRELGILRIKCNNTLLTPTQQVEAQKFISAIESSLHQFVKEFNVPNDKYSIATKKEEAGNIRSLKITFASLELYERFYHHSLKGLLPAQQQKEALTPTPQERKESERFHPNPFEKKLERK